MNNLLINTYIKPQTHLHNCFYFIQTRLIYCVIIIFILFILTPTLFYYLAQSENSLRENKKSTLIQNLTQQTKLLSTLSRKSNSLHFKDRISLINKAIEQVFTDHKIKIEQLQWNIDEKQIIITVNHQAIPLGLVLLQLQKIPNLAYTEISLSKINHQNLVQLYAVMKITD
ncbi:hypothetical protein ACWIVY_02735 [Ursidibacter sp. B-7004-1]